MAATTISTFTALGGKLVTDDSIGSGINNATGATSGRTTTANGTGTPHLMFYLPKGKSITYVIPEGHAYTSGVSVWCVSDPTVGNQSVPESEVKINLICS